MPQIGFGVRNVWNPRHHCRYGTAHTLGIYHQQRGEFQPVRNGVGTGLLRAADAVIIAHCPLEDRAVRICTNTGNQFPHGKTGQKKRIGMVCRSSGNMTMKHGVDIVRSALQALHTHAAGTEGRQQCCGNCSFSGAAADCTDQQPWDRSLHVQMLLSQIGYTFIISYLLMLFKCHTGLVKNSFLFSPAA